MGASISVNIMGLRDYPFVLSSNKSYHIEREDNRMGIAGTRETRLVDARPVSWLVAL